MKIYCILNDSIPLGNILETYLQTKGFHHFTQISNYFSTTSVISLLTGKLPSDLEKGGIGYHTHFKKEYDKYIEYSWKGQLLIHQLYKNDWDIHFHNANWFYLTICNDDFIKKTTSMPCLVNTEEEFRATKGYGKFLLDEDSIFYKNEKEFIKKIQAEKPNKNKFYFIKNNQYHQALINKSSKEQALKLIEKWFGYWDFEEEDAIFWIFSDHHDFTKIDKLCKAPSMLTWVCARDNREFKSKYYTNYIHINDFRKFINWDFRLNKDRIYFTEDARCDIDTQNSTTAVACKFIDWVNDKPKRLLQVSYYKPEDKYYGFVYDLELKKIIGIVYEFIGEFENLKEALRKRFLWIK